MKIQIVMSLEFPKGLSYVFTAMMVGKLNQSDPCITGIDD